MKSHAIDREVSRLTVRADTCPATNPVSCTATDPDLPNNFCCTASTSCLSVDNGRSVVCCPDGSSCSNLGVITCDVSLQDANNNSGPIYTTRLSDQLPSCGDRCCPFGYTCVEVGGQHVCTLDNSQLAANTSATNAPTPVPSTNNSTATDTTAELKTSNTSISPGILAAIGISGAIVGILAILILLFCLRKHKSKQSRLNEAGHEEIKQRASLSVPSSDKAELPAHSIGTSKQRHELDTAICQPTGDLLKTYTIHKFRTRDSQTSPVELA